MKRASAAVIGREAIDTAAASLRADAPLFTAGNLRHELARRHRGVPSEALDAEIARMHRKITGLVAPTGSRASKQKGRAARSAFPKAALLVDRREIGEVLVAAGEALELSAFAGLAVISIDGWPAPAVARLAKAFRDGQAVPFLYLHDAETVIYPFAIEPLATLVQHYDDASGEPIAYRDLGLPPLGTSPRRFADPQLPAEELILELDAVPPATLARYCDRVITSFLGEVSHRQPAASGADAAVRSAVRAKGPGSDRGAVSRDPAGT